ncbi:MAG: AsmA family protein, partial [Pusillimonas sp.]
MKVWLKRVLISLVVVVIVALVGIAIFLLTFDPNAYKNKLEEIVYNRYQRSLAIKGDLELSLFPRIGLSVQDVSLSNRNSTDTFASIDSARFAVAIWPLMFNRLVVDHVAVTGFKAWVTRDDKGQFN